MKKLAIVLATACLIGTAVIGVLCWIFATDRFALLWTIAVAFIFAGYALGAIAIGDRKAALAAFALHVVATGFVLIRVLGLSDNGDGKILAVWIAVEGAGIAAVLLGRKGTPLTAEQAHCHADGGRWRRKSRPIDES